MLKSLLFLVVRSLVPAERESQEPRHGTSEEVNERFDDIQGTCKSKAGQMHMSVKLRVSLEKEAV
jgi:hypothetical protein